jgi:hypothetical protein
MPSLTAQGFLVDGTTLTPREISPHALVDTFFGFDWGPPLRAVVFNLETDDGHNVEIWIEVPKQRDGNIEVTDWTAGVGLATQT